MTIQKPNRLSLLAEAGEEFLKALSGFSIERPERIKFEIIWV